MKLDSLYICKIQFSENMPSNSVLGDLIAATFVHAHSPNNLFRRSYLRVLRPIYEPLEKVEVAKSKQSNEGGNLEKEYKGSNNSPRTIFVVYIFLRGGRWNM